MHIVSIQTLRLFWQKHPDAERPLRAWYALAEKAHWRSPTEIKATLGNVSFVGTNRVIFNIKGNDYRLIVVAEYQKGRLFIRFVGTHADYDRIDPATI
jgi:mRNA interferase HigB